MEAALNKAVFPLLILISTVTAHDSWIRFFPSEGNSNIVKVEIGNGHHFPESDGLISKSLIHQFILQDCSSGTVIATDSLKETAAAWQSECPTPDSGTFMAWFSLQRSTKSGVFFTGKTVWVTPRNNDWTVIDGVLGNECIIGKDLEIVPHFTVGKSEGKSTEVSLRVLLNGQSVSADPIVIYPDGKKIYSWCSDSEPAVLPVSVTGWYLVTVTHKRQSASLTFWMP